MIYFTTCSRRRVPKEVPSGGVQGDYMAMDDFGDEDEVCLSVYL